MKGKLISSKSILWCSRCKILRYVTETYNNIQLTLWTRWARKWTGLKTNIKSHNLQLPSPPHHPFPFLLSAANTHTHTEPYNDNLCSFSDVYTIRISLYTGTPWKGVFSLFFCLLSITPNHWVYFFYPRYCIRDLISGVYWLIHLLPNKLCIKKGLAQKTTMSLPGSNNKLAELHQ